MKCPKCDKSLADESKFCMFCGTEIQSNAVDDSDTRSIRQTKPIGIYDQIVFFTQGATEIDKKGCLGTIFDLTPKTGRGFSVNFSLIDDSGQWTVADGQLIIVLREYGDNISSSTKAKHNSLFYKELVIRKEEFEWREYTDYNVRQDFKQLTYQYRHSDPLVFANG